MPKQRWRKSFNSFIDPRKDEQLRGIKTEMDGKVQKIFDFLKAKDGDVSKEAMVDLVEDFRKEYESLYARYDHLTGELRSKFGGKSGRGSASSSSDSSDSDHSPTKSESRNDEVETGLVEKSSISEREELIRKLAAAVEEKEALREEYLSVMKSKNDDVSLLREENAQLQLRNSEMEREGELSARVMALTEDVHHLREKLGYMSDEKSEADRVVQKHRGELSEILVQIENLKEELSRAENQKSDLYDKIAEQEREMKEQRDELMKLSEDHKQHELQLKDCRENLVLSEKKIEEISDQFRESMTSKNQDIYQLEEIIEDLKSELEIKEDEMSTLEENMRATEVKQRLSGQKLRITEQVLSEKEETYKKTIQKLLEEENLLEEKNDELSEIVLIYKEAEVKIIRELAVKMNETIDGMDAFNVKFEEDYGHLESRVYELNNELQVVLNWIIGNNAEKDEMKKEIMSLVQQLKDEKIQALALREKVEELEKILQKEEDERKSLTKKANELMTMVEERDEKVGELEKQIKEKESGILRLSEEKREAIRQLCISIDFHRARYDDLKGMILKRGGTREIAA